MAVSVFNDAALISGNCGRQDDQVLDGEHVDELFDEAVVEEVISALLDGARVDEDRQRLETPLNEQFRLPVVRERVRQPDIDVEEYALVLRDVRVFAHHLFDDHCWVLVELVYSL